MQVSCIVIFGPFNLDILLQADFFLQNNERQNEWFLELIPSILIPEQVQSNTP